MNNPIKYILYCAQESNFQTRSMLIPYDLIMQCLERVEHLQMLRENALRNVPFNHKGENYVVDQLLIQNITWNRNVGKHDESPFSKITSDLTSYADGMEEDWFCEVYDKKWSNDVICNISSSGFNHVVNYCNFRNKTEYKDQPIEIVEGFLVLESDDGKLRIPTVDNVEELFAKYYPEYLKAYQDYKNI